jgi:nucleotide-binding universal stress UspA family protein
MKILFATDGSSFSEAAARDLRRFPFPAHSELTILTVAEKMVALFDDRHDVPEPERQTYDQAEQAVRESAQQLLTQTLASFPAPAWNSTTMLREGRAAGEILQAAREIEADLIVLGCRGLGGVKRFLLGSVSQKVMLHAPCSVLISRPRGEEESSPPVSESVPLKLLIAYDGSDSAKAVIRTLQALPLRAETHIMVTTVLMLMTYYGMDILQTMTALWQARKEAAHTALEEVAQALRPLTPHVTVQLLEGQDPSQEILQAASTFGADCIVMGHQGRSAYERFFVGSVANRVVHHAPCSVWVMREKIPALAQE